MLRYFLVSVGQRCKAFVACLPLLLFSPIPLRAGVLPVYAALPGANPDQNAIPADYSFSNLFDFGPVQNAQDSLNVLSSALNGVALNSLLLTGNTANGLQPQLFTLSTTLGTGSAGIQTNSLQLTSSLQMDFVGSSSQTVPEPLPSWMCIAGLILAVVAARAGNRSQWIVLGALLYALVPNARGGVAGDPGVPYSWTIPLSIPADYSWNSLPPPGEPGWPSPLSLPVIDPGIFLMTGNSANFPGSPPMVFGSNLSPSGQSVTLPEPTAAWLAAAGLVSACFLLCFRIGPEKRK